MNASNSGCAGQATATTSPRAASSAPSANIKRALLAARTEAELADADTGALFVTEATVDQGPVMKRFQPKDRGRAHSIHKFFSHITVSLEEKVAN